jgi:hypothetical protein
LLKKIHSLPNQPLAIPYCTSYYKKYWGFCAADKQKKDLKKNYSNNDQFNRVNSEDSDDTINSINSEEESNYDLDLLIEDKNDAVVQVREEDLQQYRDLGMYFTLLLRLNCFTHLTYLSLDLILTERAKRFYDPKLVGIEREKCILIAVGTYLLNCLQI